MGIKHAFIDTKPDGPHDGRVNPSNWNEDHVIGDFLQAIIDLATTPNTFPYINNSGNGATSGISAVALTILARATAAQMLSDLGGAPIASPAFTGTPSAPTASLGTNTNQLATMAAVQAAISNLVSSSPAALDTLNELAAALGNDPAFATTVATALGYRLRFDASQSLSGGQKTQGLANLGVTLGTGANNVVQLDGAAKLPAIDGSQLTSVVTTGSVLYSASQSLSDAQRLQAIANLGIPFECGYFKRISATSVRLDPFNCDLIKINGKVYRIPSAGVAISNSGLASNTLHYAYAYDNSGTLTLELSTTVPTDSTTAGNVGTRIKTGDDTRTLVGLVVTDGNSPGQFTAPLTLSWLNKKARTVKATGTATTGGDAATATFATWGDQAVAVKLNAAATNSVATGLLQLQINVDGAGPSGISLRNDAVVSSSRSTVTFAGTLDALASGKHTVAQYLSYSGTPTSAEQETYVDFLG